MDHFLPAVVATAHTHKWKREREREREQGTKISGLAFMLAKIDTHARAYPYPFHAVCKSREHVLTNDDNDDCEDKRNNHAPA